MPIAKRLLRKLWRAACFCRGGCYKIKAYNNFAHVIFYGEQRFWIKRGVALHALQREIWDKPDGRFPAKITAIQSTQAKMAAMVLKENEPMTKKPTIKTSNSPLSEPGEPEMMGLKLNMAQRELILHWTSLPEEAVGRLKSASDPQTISFTLSELDALYDQLLEASWETKGNEKQKVLRIHEKVSALLGSQIKPEQLAPERSDLSPPTSTAYQIKIVLMGIEPTIWRRFRVDDGSLEQLHWHLQVVMGWESEHLYLFTIGQTEFVDFSSAGDPYEQRDVCVTRLSDVIPKQNRRPRFHYEYDFGDCWLHQLIVEEQFTADPAVRYPICLEGERACPPEDCGGPAGYANFVEAIENPAHEEHEELLEWVGEEFDAEKYDLNAVNTELRSMERE